MSEAFQRILEQAHGERRWVTRSFQRCVYVDGAGLILGEAHRGGPLTDGDWHASRGGVSLGYYINEESAKAAVEKKA